MGCLNANQGFSHWFGNIHLSGPCNRSCNFCIGQHMMALDSLNNLDIWPLKNIDKFVADCKVHGINEINITGSNTDPLLYKHTHQLKSYLLNHFPNLVLGLRTNGVLALGRKDIWGLYDKASITVCSFHPDIYVQMMGSGQPPNIKKIVEISGNKPIKINTVLGPENVKTNDVFQTIRMASEFGIKKMNLREPYGQPHVGNPFEMNGIEPTGYRLGMPYYLYEGIDVTYWDVHFVEVESVNLYANGQASVLYPISKGHCPITGKVLGQEHWSTPGRLTPQWQYSE